MPRVDVQIPTSDGVSNGSLHVPDGAGPWPGVVVFPDAFGLRDTMRDMGDHLASLGYVALVPDVFYRAGDWAPFDPSHRVHRREGTRAALRPHERPHQRPGHRRRGRLRRLPAGPAGGARHRRRNHRLLHGRPHVAGGGGRHRGQDRRGRVVPRGAGRHPRRPEQPAPGGRQHPRRGLRGRLHRRPGVHRRARRTARQRADLGRRAAHYRVLPRAPRVRRAGQRALRPCAGRSALGGAARFLRRAALIRWTRDYAGAGRNVAAKAWK